ncbi:MAG TPA: glutathione S-transferase N-terminal domain-containing protein [Devosia sp.]|nr:glutathione S-transferase N-terminal domain-containing protein [Devosia sp.]
MTAPIHLYYFNSPNGRKITIMLEELGVPYTLIPISMSRRDQYRPDYSVISPNNKMPAIVDPEGPEGKAVPIFESGAILKYLAEKYQRFYGASWAERVKIDEWLFWQVGGFGPLLGQKEHFIGKDREPIPYAVKRYTDETQRLYGVLDGQLSRQAARGIDFVAGDGFSIADIAIFGWARKWDDLKVSRADFPMVARWHDSIDARPAVQRALALAASIPRPAPDPGEALARDLELLGVRLGA